eukprot:m.785715 g.785715  ORF g.785715 m.785715 type:complete len:50 (+) comp23303_c0_seq1:3024-3173(+)
MVATCDAQNNKIPSAADMAAVPISNEERSLRALACLVHTVAKKSESTFT